MTAVAPREGGAAMFWAIALACVLAAVAGLTASLAVRLADASAHNLRTGLAARVVAPDTPEALAGAETALRAAPGVEFAEVLTQDRAAGMLRGGLGVDAAAVELPPLRVIQFRAKTTPTADWLRETEQRLRGVGYDVEIYGPSATRITAAQNAQVAAIGALAVSGALAIAALLTTGLAGRARAAADRGVIPALADLGATRGQVARIFAGRAAMEGFTAGLVGAFAATVVCGWLLTREDGAAPLSALAQQLDMRDGAILLATPLLAALLAAAGARAASNRFYKIAARRR
ncbi:MAG: hypothetical protein AB7M12_04630 [Hyphomonadaceae bacterium]